MSQLSNPNPFSNLPEISFADFDVVDWENFIIQGFQNAWLEQTNQVVVLSPADRRYNFLMSLAVFFNAAYQQIDWSAKMQLLPLSQGGFLDVVCALFGALRSPRLSASGAQTTLQFSYDNSSGGSPLDIPQGTTVSDTSGTNLIFATNADVQISAGATTASVAATCTTTGIAANGLLTSTISYLLGWSNLTFTPTVTNTTATSGGSDIESDQAYAARMFTVTDSFSNAGSYGAYQFFGERADPTISQIAVSGPEDGLLPGNVLLTVLCDGGAMPSNSVLSAVNSAVSANNIRDLCANVTVAAPSGVNFSVNVSYYVPTYLSNNLANVQNAVTAAVNSFVTGITQQLSANIDPSVLIQKMVDAQAVHVTVTQPSAFKSLANWQVGVLTSQAVTYSGTI